MKLINNSKDGLKQIIDGMNLVANTVKVTLGAAGRTVLLEKPMCFPYSSDDGVTIVRDIELKDPLHNMGCELLKEVAILTNDKAGDGTTTSIILAQAIASEGFKNVVAGTNPILIKKGIEKAVEYVIKQLELRSKKITTKEEIAQVANISAKDQEIGNMIADLMEKVGENGVITVKEGHKIGLESEHVDGLRFDRGYLSPYMITDNEKVEAVYNDAHILITDKRISTITSILPIIEALAKTGGSELVIIAEDVEGEALATLILNKKIDRFKTLAIKAPSLGTIRKDMLQDIAILTGGRFITEDLNMKLEDIKIEDLGRAERVISDRNNTTIINGRGDKTKLEERKDEIRSLLSITKAIYNIGKLNERLAKLSGGIAVIKVGAATEVEMKERKDRIEDALNATKAVKEEGVVAGGGSAFAQIAKGMEELEVDERKPLTEEERIGMQIVMRALTYPLYYIAENAGYKGDAIVSRVQELEQGMGFNTITGEYVDMIKEGIIDPVKVERLALQNAASISMMLLTTEAIVYNDPNDKKENE